MLKALDLPAQPFDLVYRLANEAQVTPPVGADAIEEGWKEQRHGIVQKGERERSDWITKTLLAFEPATEKEKIIHTETVRQAAQN